MTDRRNRPTAAAAASRISPAANSPFIRPSSLPTAISRALRMPNGLGGEPGSQTSTGTVAPTPPVTASLSLSSPPLTASVPTAMTTLGSGIPS